MNKFILAILLSIVSCQLSIVSCFAQSKNDFSVSIDPSIIEIEATAPSSPEVNIKLTNKTEKEISFDLELLPFSMENSGQIKYLGKDESKAIIARIKNRIKVYDAGIAITAVKLVPLESKILKLKVDVDQNLASGDYYLALVFSTQNITAQKSTVASKGGIASLVLLSIAPGKTMGRIAEFSSPFITSGPVPFKLMVGNDSNHYVIPRGRIKITDMFGKSVGRVDILPQYILANSNRLLIDSKKAGLADQTLVWPEKFLLGIYRAELTLNMSEKGPTYTRTIMFASFPVLIVMGITAIAFIASGIIIKAIRRRQRK
jgi:hypothetical protein